MTPRLRYQITPEDTVFMTFGPGVCARVPVREAARFANALLNDLSDEPPIHKSGPSTEAQARRNAILRRLITGGPCQARELAAASGELPVYISRTMGDLVKAGLVETDGKGRGRRATYSITALGRARLEEWK